MPTIYKEKKAVLLKLREPSRVTTVIPTAKLAVTPKGDTVVAVPHRPDETKVLRNLGFTDIPNPMPVHYTWPGRYTPFKAQYSTADAMSMERRFYCLNSMGTGKTEATLWAYDYLRTVKQAKKLLVVCPLSTMERTWADSIFFSFPHLRAAVLYGTRDKRLKLLANKDFDIYIVNTDGVKIIEKALIDRDDIDFVVVDELAMFRNAQTDRWKAMNKIVNKQQGGTRRVWGLTGSPTPNEPTDAWAQCRLITPFDPALPTYFNKFRDLVMRQVSQYKYVPLPNAAETVHSFMRPAVRFTLEDCQDLPPQIFQTYDIELSKEQMTAYREMLARLKAESDAGQILAINEAVKGNKLLQICCGVAYAVDGTEIMIGAPSRIEQLKEIINGSEGKVIVFVPLTGALNYVVGELSNEFSVRSIHGETSKSVRDEIFRAFQDDPEPRVLVANPGTMSHGLTLTAATTICWYAPIWGAEIYEQANARVRRPGQKRSTVIAHIAGSEMERKVYARLKDKQALQSVLLDLIKESNEQAIA
jgi:SNF2 family DNA or RNA helicase